MLTQLRRWRKATGDVRAGLLRPGSHREVPTPRLLAIMRQQVVTHEKDAHVTVSTAHRSKGLEWDVVVLNEVREITDKWLSEYNC